MGRAPPLIGDWFSGKCYAVTERGWKRIALTVAAIIVAEKVWEFFLADNFTYDDDQCNMYGQGSSDGRRLSAGSPAEALHFLIVIICTGTALMYILTFKIFHGMQQTVGL